MNKYREMENKNRRKKRERLNLFWLNLRYKMKTVMHIHTYKT